MKSMTYRMAFCFTRPSILRFRECAFLKVCFLITLIYSYNSDTSQTPNFGITGHDIPSAPTNSNRQSNRLILQYTPGFEMPSSLECTAPHNKDARLPQDTTSQGPSDMLLDMSYAAFALQAWGSHDFIRYVQSETNGIYY